MKNAFCLLAAWLGTAAVLAAQVSAEREWLERRLSLAGSGPHFLILALGVAFFLGAAHGLTPGHGKTLVAAYLVGSRGAIRDAIYLGSVVTITHTSSVFVLGFLTLFASRYILMDRIYPWLSAASGLLVAGMGVWLFRRRWSGVDHHHHGHARVHSEEAGPSSVRTHAGAEDPGHGHEHVHNSASEQAQAAMHAHARASEHGHAHGATGHSHADLPEHRHHHEHGHTHVLQPPGVSRWELLSLGVSGGLVPCPEAMVVLLMAISMHRLGTGMVILVAFSLGLAAVLIAIGIAMILSGPLVNRLTPTGWVSRALPVGSAAVVTLLGVGIVYKAIVDNRLLHF